MLEHSTENPKVEGLNSAASTSREKVEKTPMSSMLATEAQCSNNQLIIKTASTSGSNTVLVHSTENSKVEGLNSAASTSREKMVKTPMSSMLATEAQC